MSSTHPFPIRLSSRLPFRRSSVRATLGAALAATLSAALPPSTDAQTQKETRPDPATGMALAERLCSNCHVVGGAQETAVPAGVPTLRGLANQAGQTARRIENALIQPHTPMPDLRLSNPEIQHILAYLETLRTNPEVPPLSMPPPEEKPKYPKPS